MYSDILDEYVKVITDKDITKTAADTDDDRKTKNLYNIKPNGDDEDILDQAHPETIVLHPAYDRMNAVVENLKERSNIMCDIALRNPTGDLTQKRYVKAKKELLDEIMKISLMLDKKNETDLMKISDNCYEGLTKQGVLFITVAGIIAGVVGLAATLFGSLSTNISTVIGVKQNALKAKEELQDIDDDLPGIEAEIQPLHMLLDLLIKAATIFESIKPPTHAITTRVRSVDSAKNMVNKTKDNYQQLYKQKSFDIINYYKRACDLAKRGLPYYISLLKLRSDQKQEALGTARKWLSGIKEFFVQSDVEDVTDELEALVQAISKSRSQIEAIKQLIQDAEDQQNKMQQLDNTLVELDQKKQELSGITSHIPQQRVPIQQKELEQLQLDLSNIKEL